MRVAAAGAGGTCSGRRTPTSRHGKLEQKRAAAGVGRKDHRRRGARRNLNYRLDFGAREPPARQRVVCASGTSAMRMAVSLEKTHLASGQNRTDAARWGKYSAELSWSSTASAPAAEMRAKRGEESRRQRNRMRAATGNSCPHARDLPDFVSRQINSAGGLLRLRGRLADGK